jgi:squalene-hopene/tetraprenyl-beta-curcumene cyclase
MSATLIHSADPPLARERLIDGIRRGIESLERQQNDDGGFGDTDRSHSNIATSYLVLAASTLAGQAIGRSLPSQQVDQLELYLRNRGELDALRARYGTDKTFVVPIMTNLAIAGLVDWSKIPGLPFEAAVFPQSMYRLLRMPVVSYAIPALVAIGQARHFHGRKAFLPLRWIRAASVGRTMKVLRRMQPESGGYLEATPLTAFVVMSLAVTGRSNHDVARCGLQFLVESMDQEGSWPIDTNLATWVTSLSMHALGCDPEDDGHWCTPELLQWHLNCQHLQRHPFTGAEPGGWGWSDLSGAVPDSDDTPAAMLALGRAVRWQSDQQKEILRAMTAGSRWLRRLQNRDGGWPTFCRGWGKLPFDRSSNDLTAHAIRALTVASEIGIADASAPGPLSKAKAFLERNQQADGSWLPLWFGNQDRADESNPVYGTSRVLVAAHGFLASEAVRRGCRYLIESQNEDGGWGGGPSLTDWLNRMERQPSEDWRSPGGTVASGPALKTTSSLEESSLAVEALCTVLLSAGVSLRNQQVVEGVEECGSGLDSATPPQGTSPAAGGNGGKATPRNSENPEKRAAKRESTRLPLDGGGKEAVCEAIIRGVQFMLDSLDADRHRVAWPIGFYFAKLWYHEQLYPLIFASSALGKYLRVSAEELDSDWPR